MTQTEGTPEGLYAQKKKKKQPLTESGRDTEGLH